MPTEKDAEIFPRTQQRKRRAVDEPRGTRRMRLGRYNCAYDSQESGGSEMPTEKHAGVFPRIIVLCRSAGSDEW